MKRGRVTAVFIVTLLGIVLLAAHAFIPPYVAQRMEEALRARIPRHESIEVRLTSFPIYNLFRGRLDRVEVQLHRPTIQDVELAWFMVNGTNVFLDVKSLLAGRLDVRAADQLQLEAAIDEMGLAQYLQSQLDGVSDLRVELLPGHAVVYGRTPFLGRPIDVSVRGTVRLVGTDVVRFVPENVTIEDQSVPRALVEAIAALWRWDLSLAGLPFTTELTNVDLAPGVLTAHGQWTQAE